MTAATHGSTMTALVQGILADSGIKEKMIYWWTVPEKHIQLATRNAWCFGCLMSQVIFFPVVAPCICCGVSANKTLMRSQVWILTESKILAYRNAEMCCGSTGKDLKEYELSTILSIQVDNAGTGCCNHGGGVQLQLPGIVVTSNHAQQGSILVMCEDPNASAKIIREQKESAMQMNVGAPSQMGMGAGGGNDIMDQILKLKTLLDAGAITQNEYDMKKTELMAKMG